MAEFSRTKLDLRTKPQPIPEQAWMPGQGIPPLQPGTVRKVTAAEANVLMEAGWKDGEPIPGNFAEVRQALLDEQRRETETLLPVAPDTPPLSVRIQPIETLSPERREYLRKAMQEVQEAARAIPAAEVMAVPGLDAALRTAGETTAPTGPQSAGRFLGQTVTTDRKQPTQFQVDHAPQNLNNVIEPQPEKFNSVIEPPAETPAGHNVLKHCPNCDFDLAKTDPVEPTREDKLNFLVALEGMTRFRKEYPLLDGNYRVIFRQPTTAESHTVFEQLSSEFQDGTLTEQGAYFAQVLNYRLVLSLEAIETPKGRRAVPLLEDVVVDAPKPGAPKKTALPELYAYLRESVLPNEAMFHIVIKAFQDFQRIVDRMEANWNNPDFYKGISGQP